VDCGVFAIFHDDALHHLGAPLTNTGDLMAYNETLAGRIRKHLCNLMEVVERKNVRRFGPLW
jgi:hypothetical protein